MEKTQEEFMIYVRLAFEYGIILTETARSLNVEVNKDLVERMERVINGEFPTHTPEHLAVNMLPLVMAALEPVDKVELERINKQKAMAKGTKKGGMKGGKGGKGC